MASSLSSHSTPKARASRDSARRRILLVHLQTLKPPLSFEEDRVEVDASLDRLMPAETAPPPSIHQAMRYSVFAGGKRIRPILCLETARIFDSSVRPAHYPACAIEFIHTYSLIHDDLPALDNDDLRRGKPTSHKKFGEAAAILAGDALLTLAFETIAATPVDASRRVAMLAEISTAAGTINGMEISANIATRR